MLALSRTKYGSCRPQGGTCADAKVPILRRMAAPDRFYEIQSGADCGVELRQVPQKGSGLTVIEH